MHTAFLGTDHTRTPIELLEKVYFNENQTQKFIESLPPESPIAKIVILSTCNRVEIYYTCEEPALVDPWLRQFVKDFFGAGDVIDSLWVNAWCEDAVYHLFRVASGVESMVFGENEILTQIKLAYQRCADLGATGSFLNKLFQTAISVGKRVRDETDIGRGAYSVSSIAVDLVLEEASADTPILIVGAGLMGIRAMRKLSALQHNALYATNRSADKLKLITHKFEFEEVDYENWKIRLPEFEHVIVATTADSHVLRPEDIEKIEITRPIHIVDLGVPRNVDPEIANVDQIQLTSIDALKTVAQKNIHLKRQQIDQINEILANEFAEFNKWYQYKKDLQSA